MRNRLFWILLLSALFIVLILAILLRLSILSNPILQLRADLGTLLIILATLIALLLTLIGWFLREWMNWVQDRIQTQAAYDWRRFLTRLEHELKNPLTAIRAGLANLAATQDIEARREALASVEDEIVRLSGLAADLRKLAELETQPLERTSVTIAKLLQDAVTLAREQPEAENRHLTLEVPQAPWPLPPILADEDLLFRAIYNLLSNSLKFTRPGDTIQVRAFENGQRVLIVVADTGLGIPEEEVPYVWKDQYRGQKGHVIPGSGLGLALVEDIIHRHGGQVNLRSRVEQGTEVTVQLPVE